MTNSTNDAMTNYLALWEAFADNECVDVSYNDMIEELKNESIFTGVGGRQWFYQTCVEFGYYQVTCFHTLICIAHVVRLDLWRNCPTFRKPFQCLYPNPTMQGCLRIRFLARRQLDHHRVWWTRPRWFQHLVGERFHWPLARIGSPCCSPRCCFQDPLDQRNWYEPLHLNFLISSLANYHFLIAHCGDMIPPFSGSPSTLAPAQQVILQQLQAWLTAQSK